MAYPIVVLISGSGTNLQQIIDKCHVPGIVNIKAVVSDNPTAYGLTRAGRARIDQVVKCQLGSETREAYCAALANAVASYDPRLIVLAGFMKILTASFVDVFPNRIINIHPALLPKHKGLHTHRRVLEAGDNEHGISIHWVTEELDAGPIILQRAFQVLPDDTEETLEQRVHELEYEWFPQVINDIAQGRVR